MRVGLGGRGEKSSDKKKRGDVSRLFLYIIFQFLPVILKFS
jgi:hypothetical protein